MRMIDADQAVEEIDDIFSVDDGKGLIPVGITKALVKSMLTLESITPTVCSWISVTDQLPEEHADEHPYEFEQFLCATVWNDVRMVGFGTRIGDDKQHFWSGASIWDDWVTHWMPLPELPKEDDGK